VVLEDGRLVVADEIEGPSEGEHVCEQIWQLGPAAGQVNMTFSAPAERSPSKFSPAYGVKRVGECLNVRVAGRLPLRITMVLEANGSGAVSEDEECLQRADSLALGYRLGNTRRT
jgi:hypothetical protein